MSFVEVKREKYQKHRTPFDLFLLRFCHLNFDCVDSFAVGILFYLTLGPFDCVFCCPNFLNFDKDIAKHRKPVLFFFCFFVVL